LTFLPPLRPSHGRELQIQNCPRIISLLVSTGILATAGIAASCEHRNRDTTADPVSRITRERSCNAVPTRRARLHEWRCGRKLFGARGSNRVEARRARSDFIQAARRRTIRDALVPPNPKELDSTTLISRLRAWCGTRSIGVSTDGLSRLIVGGAT
jgi:hypothetical protein